MKTKWLFTGLMVAVLAGCGASNDSGDSAAPGAEEEAAMEEAPVEGVTFRFIETNGINMRIAEAGGDEGELVLLVHGWPESWYSYRHQIPALVEAGYRVVVPEMRGYGKTESPEDVDSFDIVNLAKDMVGVLDAVGVENRSSMKDRSS